MKSIAYSDGQTLENRIVEILKNTPESELHSNSWIAREQYGEWAVHYHLSPERANLVRHLNWNGLDVLELGAGMGAVSRYVAEEARSLTVVEGTQVRFDALSARLRNLKNWSGQVSNIEDFQTEQRFDVVMVIGVLEYSELYIRAEPGETPHDAFLRKARSFLKPGGVLVLAIENRLGAKYWSGCAEDHTSRIFDGVCGYAARPTPRTFSRQELRALFQRAGFQAIEEQFPFPDYKLPRSVLTARMMVEEPGISADIAGSVEMAGRGQPRMHYFPDILAVHGVARAGLLAEFSNSFLFVASDSADSPTLARLLEREWRGGLKTGGEWAWHYSLGRPAPSVTTFVGTRGELGIRVVKAPLSCTTPTADGAVDVPGISVRWHARSEESLIRGTSLREQLLRRAYFEGLDALQTELGRFLKWSFQHWRQGKGLSGKAIDATWSNVFLPNTHEEGYQIFDLEWEATEPIPKRLFVFRNALTFAFISDFRVFASSGWGLSLRKLYESLCSDFGIESSYEEDLNWEAAFQQAVGPRGRSLEVCRAELDRAMNLVDSPEDSALDNSEDRERALVTQNFQLRSELAALQGTVQGLRQILRRTEHRIAGKAAGLLGLR